MHSSALYVLNLLNSCKNKKHLLTNENVSQTSFFATCCGYTCGQRIVCVIIFLHNFPGILKFLCVIKPTILYGQC